MMQHDKAASAAVAWWRSLQPDPPREAGDRAALARLRRCSTVADAMQERAALSLFRFIGGAGPSDLPAAGLAAAVLAHVRVDATLTAPGVSAARQLGPDNIDAPETAVLKPLRFRRLIEAGDHDEHLVAFRRMAALAGGRLPVRDLANALLFWSDQQKTRWIYDYWNVASPSFSPSKDAAQ
jgi:CRISPR system Cascade subunit CasB